LLKTALLIAFALAGLYILVGLFLFLFQSRLIYFPRREMGMTPADAGLPFEDLTIPTADGLRLNAWLVPLEGSQVTVLYFHGNAGNISNRIETIRQFRDMGFTTLIVDYRGYGRSEGEPDEEGTYLDAEAAWDYLVNVRGISADSIVILGRSLGGAVAAYLASKVTPRALVLESTFTSIPDRGAELYPYFPARILARIEYNSLGRMRSVQCPVLIVHSPEDEIVPFAHGQKLFDAAGEPKGVSSYQRRAQ
jgi:fermentation-respiration switch protein FrsA (DUF1100 family)